MNPKLIWPFLYTCFIDDGFGITTGVCGVIIYWIDKFNELRDTLPINKYNWGNVLDVKNLLIYKGDTFYSDGKLSISIHQKESNKFIFGGN